jgi:hypothetical protein
LFLAVEPYARRKTRWRVFWNLFDLIDIAATTDSKLECTRDFFERLKSDVNAVQVSLEDVWVHIAQVHWLCSISCDPLWLACSGEEFGSLGKDVGVYREALHMPRQLANTDVESEAEIMSIRC